MTKLSEARFELFEERLLGQFERVHEQLDRFDERLDHTNGRLDVFQLHLVVGVIAFCAMVFAGFGVLGALIVT